MGKLLSKIFGNKEMRILMLGLDAAGKTSKNLIMTIFVLVNNLMVCFFSNFIQIKIRTVGDNNSNCRL